MAKLGAAAFVLLCLLVCRGESELVYPVGDVRNCPQAPTQNSTVPLLRMEVLPGTGFDNLRNMDMSQVVQYNYSLCKTTNDGRYLLPDDVFVIPIQHSRVESYGVFYDHWDNFTSFTSTSINAEASVFSFIDGKFGFEYQHVKQHQVNNEAKTTSVQIKHILYKVKLQPDPQLHPTFKNRLLDIGANIQNNNTQLAYYLTELLVRDYGTHIVTSADAGALLAQVDSISSQYVEDSQGDTTGITASLSVNFMSKFSGGISSGFSSGINDDSKYISSRYHSQFLTYGGPPYRINMTLDKWEDGVPDALVAVDRSGDPLHYIITTDSLPELPTPTLFQVEELVYSTVMTYYRVNTHHGCTDPASKNFNFEANLNDGSCEAPKTNYSFGGVYQTCQESSPDEYEDLCQKGASQVNPLTGSFSCPSGYEAVELHSGVKTHTAMKTICNNVCHHCSLFGWGRCCQCVSAQISVLSSANYQAYWCVATGEVESNQGYLFGGVYTSKSINPVTRSMTCPNHFYPLFVGEDLAVCVSDEYEYAYAYSVPFGGFQSCLSGNPLAGSSRPKRCPKTYKQVLATVDEGCEINYCAQIKSQYSVKPPVMPPFRSKPGIKLNVTQASIIKGPHGAIWLRNADSTWHKHPLDVTGESMLQYLTPSSEEPIAPDNGDSGNIVSGKTDSGSLSAGASAGISVALTLLACTLIVVGVYGALRRRRSHVTSSLSYQEITEKDDRITDRTPVINSATAEDV